MPETCFFGQGGPRGVCERETLLLFEPEIQCHDQVPERQQCYAAGKVIARYKNIRDKDRYAYSSYPLILRIQSVCMHLRAHVPMLPRIRKMLKCVMLSGSYLWPVGRESTKVLAARIRLLHIA